MWSPLTQEASSDFCGPRGKISTSPLIAPYHASASISAPFYASRSPFPFLFPSTVLCFQRLRLTFFIFIIFGARHDAWGMEELISVFGVRGGGRKHSGFSNAVKKMGIVWNDVLLVPPSSPENKDSHSIGTCSQTTLRLMPRLHFKVTLVVDRIHLLLVLEN